MVSEASNARNLVHGARLSVRASVLTKLQKKAPNALKLRDAELKSAPCSGWTKIDPVARAKRRTTC